MKSVFFILSSLFFLSCIDQVNKPSPEVNFVEVGKKFYINLPENHTTGYIWQLSNSYDYTKLTYLNAVFHGNKKGINFNFEGLDKGKTTLDFMLIKYRDTSDVKSFIIEVK